MSISFALYACLNNDAQRTRLRLRYTTERTMRLMSLERERSLSVRCRVSFSHPGCLRRPLTGYVSRVVELVFASD